MSSYGAITHNICLFVSAWVARWSSSGQKHHAFLGFKVPNAASKALGMNMPRNRDWRLSRLNPDLKTRVIDLLPKFVQAKIKAEETAYARWIESNPPPPMSGPLDSAPNGANVHPSGLPSSGSGPGEQWQPLPNDHPPSDRLNNGERPNSPMRMDDGRYGWVNQPSGVPQPWGNAWDNPQQFAPQPNPEYLPYGAPQDQYAMAPPGAPMILDNHYQPPLPPPGDISNSYLPVRPSSRAANPYDAGPGPRSPSHWSLDVARPNSPPNSFPTGGNLPPKPVGASDRAPDRDSRYPADRYPASRHPLTPPRLPPRGFSPPRSSRDYAPNPPPPNRGRKDSRADDRDKDTLRDSWNAARRERGDRDRNHDRGRPRSPSRLGDRERDYKERERDRDRERGRPASRSPGPRPSRGGNGPSGNGASRSNQNGNQSNGDFKFTREHDASGALSPGQVSTVSRSSNINGGAPRSRHSRSPTPVPGRAALVTAVQVADVDVPALIEALSKHKAPVASWIEVISRFRRRNELDIADKVRMSCFVICIPELTVARIGFLQIAVAGVEGRLIPRLSASPSAHQQTSSVCC